MSLMGRPKAKTHKGMAMDKMMRLALEVEEIASGGQVTAEALDDLSSDLGIPTEKLYAGLAMSHGTQLEGEHATQFVVCTGGCQDYGALDCVRELLDLRQDRVDEDTPAFDVIPRPCLNRCQNAPAVEVRTPDGTGLLLDASPSDMRAAVTELLG